MTVDLPKIKNFQREQTVVSQNLGAYLEKSSLTLRSSKIYTRKVSTKVSTKVGTNVSLLSEPKVVYENNEAKLFALRDSGTQVQGVGTKYKIQFLFLYFQYNKDSVSKCCKLQGLYIIKST